MDDRHLTWAVEYLVESEQFPRYSARIDRVKYNPKTGKFTLVDHKTAKTYDAKLLLSYRIEPQFLGIIWLWQTIAAPMLGEMEDFEVNLVTKAQAMVCDIVHVPFQDKYLLSQWLNSTRYYDRTLQALHKSVGHWPKNYGYHCRFCNAFDHCATGGRSLKGWIRKTKEDY